VCESVQASTAQGAGQPVLSDDRMADAVSANVEEPPDAEVGGERRGPHPARGVRLWFEFLGQAGVGWADAGVEDVARFVAWLGAPAGNLIVLETGTGRRASSAALTARD
jgi:hypothetical protein